MELKIHICANESCKVTITDLTTDYQDESNTNSNYGKFRYSDTMSIDVLQHNKVDATVLQTPVFSIHEKQTKSITLPVAFDGWFEVQHIVLPTEEWFKNELAKGSTSILGMYTGVYYTNGQNIFKYYNGESTAVPLEEIVERNTEGTTISRCSQNYVSICFLRKCYINLCQQIFNARAFDKCWNKNKIDSELIFKRDLVWMAINVIKYMVEFNQFQEAARLIYRLNGCNGLCMSQYSKSVSSGCGCNK